MSSLGTRHAITGVASSTAKAANNPSFLPARITHMSVGSFSGQHKEQGDLLPANLPVWPAHLAYRKRPSTLALRAI
jgi:hypothetical protein